MEEQKRANEIFDAFRDELLKRELSNTENYDKSILTLSAAALGISLTAIRFVVPLDGAEYIWLIKASWLLLLLSIIAALCAFLLSNKAISIQLKNAEDYYIEGVAEAFNRKNIYTKINNCFNKITGLFFALAISAIVAFVTININSGSEKMSNDNKNILTGTQPCHESADVPMMQRVPTDVSIGQNSATIPSMQQAPGTQETSQNSSSGNESNQK